MHHLSRPIAAAAAALLLAGCAGARAAEAPTWVPAPSFQGEGNQPSAVPNIPVPASPSGTPGGSGTSTGTNPSGASDPAIVATRLTTPDAIAVLPDGDALVGERTTGRIVQVQPKPGQPVTVIRTLSGLNTAGGGGLLDLALSPNYSQDNLIFAYITTPQDNRVVDFTLTGPLTPVLTGIASGTSDNTGRIAFGDDGLLYVGTGDAGQPQLAADANSLAGKVLRITEIGHAAPNNPRAGSPVFTSGHHLVSGLCDVAQSNALLDVEAAGTDGRSHVNLLTGGSSYGWPQPTPTTAAALADLPRTAAAPGGCAVVNNTLYVTSLDGKALVAAALTARGTSFTFAAFQTYLQNTYGRLLALRGASDGSLWITTSNRDGQGRPVADDERVIHIQAPAGGPANYPG